MKLIEPTGTPAERRISRIAREWTATVDTIPDYISLIDRSFTILRVNMSLARALSKEPRDLVGRPCFEAVHGRREPWPGCPHLDAIRQRRSVAGEVDDPLLGAHLLVTCSPFFDERGALAGTVHVARDIGAQKAAERQRDRLISQLQDALSRVRLLDGMLPICSCCKKIRDDRGYWRQIEEYISDHSEAGFSHGICPECVSTRYPDFSD